MLFSPKFSLSNIHVKLTAKGLLRSFQLLSGFKKNTLVFRAGVCSSTKNMMFTYVCLWFCTGIRSNIFVYFARLLSLIWHFAHTVSVLVYPLTLWITLQDWQVFSHLTCFYISFNNPNHIHHDSFSLSFHFPLACWLFPCLFLLIHSKKPNTLLTSLWEGYFWTVWAEGFIIL